MSGEHSPEMDAFVTEARAVRVEQAFERCGHNLSRLRRTGGEYVGPCPACGGKDRFSIAPAKGVFNCRSFGGGDAIKLAQHLTGQDFLDACEILTGQERPDRAEGDEPERAERRRAAEARIAEQARVAAAADAKREADSEFYRQKELKKCLAIWGEAGPFFDPDLSHARDYLRLRGLSSDRVSPQHLRCHPDLPFWAKDASGRNVVAHRGPAMIGQFNLIGDGRYVSIGIHITWLDCHASASKFRPVILDPSDPTGDPLPTKKMRGSKAGGLIPVIGRLSAATRMVAGEGIETVLGYAARDGFRADTFYCAAGDLGNLCGRATKESYFAHPTALKLGMGGRKTRVWVPGYEPDEHSVCLPVPEAISELVLLGDGDSEPEMTFAALTRGVKRHAREGRICRGEMADAGSDFAEMARELETA